MPAAAEAGDSTMQTSPPPPPPIPSPATGKAPLNDSNSVALSRPVITDQSELDTSSPLKVIGSHSPATQSPATGNPLPVDSNSVALSLNAITDVSEIDTSVPLKAINSPSPSKNCTTNMYNSELIEGKSVKSTNKRPRSVGNEVRKRSLRSRTVVIRDSPLRKSSRLSSVKCRLLALPEGLLASERRVSKKAKIDSGKRVFNGEENRNEAALPGGSVSGKKVSKMVKNDSGKRGFNGGENGSAVAIRPVGSESGLVKVPTIFGDGRGWEEIGSYFEPCLVEFSGNDDKLEEIGTSSGPESAYGKTLEEIRGYFEEVEEMETKPCLMGLSLGDGKIVDIASYSTTSGLSGKHLSSQKVQCEELKSGIELFDFSLDGGPRDNQETCACVEEKMSEQVPIIGGVGNSLEEVRTYFEEIKEVETEPCLMELFVSDDRREEIEANSYSSGLSRTCLSTREVQCKESKSGIESFDFSPYGSLRDNQETHACIEEKMSESETPCSFVGEPVLEEEAQRRWGWRYELKNQKENQQCGKLNAGEEDEIILNVKCHYTRAKVNDCIINLGDCALIKGDGREKHVGKILEFFQTTDGEDYFRVQWFYRAEDTVMQKQAASHDKKRLFYSTVMNDNMLDCIISKVSVIEVAPTLSSQPRCFSSDFYYDTEYCVEYSTFRNLPRDDSEKSCEPFAPGVSEAINAVITSTPLEKTPSREVYKPELALLDLYSGCGGMSTGLCLGAKLSSVNLVTRWAVDANQAACDTLKLNHPETLVRKQNAEDFLELLKEWHKLCQRYVLNHLDKPLRSRVKDVKKVKGNVNSPNDVKISAGEYVVQRLVDICYGDPCKTGKPGIKFKVRWLGYDSSDDTWEPIEGLSNCQERIEDFVKSGYKSKILPLPGDVDVLCGGPPCQGISGYNRHRNVDSPLTDERNRQIIVFMDIVKFLRPKYVLMENVNDILKFDKASLGRYAISRLIHMKYQARLGNMASGCYGLPQFRLRVFLWGALPSEKLPQFPLPSHDVVVRYWPATEFERNTVAYDEGQHRDLEGAVVLRDAISDLQAVTSHETREQMSYELPPETEFQKFIRLTKDEMMGFAGKRPEDAKNNILYDHRPLSLPEDDILRVSQIPHKKGANFRDLPGVIVRPDNVAYQDPKNEVKLPSGKPLVPNSAFAFDQGKSKRPYARVWWDENVATIVTYPNIHAQAVLHPEQDRVFTIREFARLQGFPDYYRFCGSVVERYRQVGNAVSVPVARALGYCLGIAIRKLGGDEPLMTLPPKFAFQRTPTDEILLSHK